MFKPNSTHTASSRVFVRLIFSCVCRNSCRVTEICWLVIRFFDSVSGYVMAPGIGASLKYPCLDPEKDAKAIVTKEIEKDVQLENALWTAGEQNTINP